MFWNIVGIFLPSFNCTALIHLRLTNYELFSMKKGKKKKISIRDHQREVVREKVGINYQLSISMNSRCCSVVDLALDSAWCWGILSPNPRFLVQEHSWRSFEKRCRRWCLPWLMSQSMEYRFWIGTIAEHVSLTPEEDLTFWKLCEWQKDSNLLLDSPNQSCCPTRRTGNALDSLDWLESRIRRATSRDSWMCLELLYRRRERSSQRHDRKQRQAIGSALDQLCPISKIAIRQMFRNKNKSSQWLTCIVTTRSSTTTSFVKKSAPIVALYWLEKRLFTYWFISDVLPTELSPKMMTFRRTFFLVAIIISATTRT